MAPRRDRDIDVPAEHARLVDEVCDRFENAWLSGWRPKIEEYLDGVPQDARAFLVGELLKIELEQRLHLGERPQLDEYWTRLPHFRTLLECFEWAVKVKRPDDGMQTVPYRPEPPQSDFWTNSVAELPPGMLVQNRYEIVRTIGRGGMGAVYEAIDRHLGNTVALKQRLVTGAESARAFEREAKLLASLSHQGLPQVTDHFQEGTHQFLVMEFVPGEDLGHWLKSRGRPFPPTVVMRWAEQLLSILTYLHEQKPAVVHRDIKPENLKEAASGHIVLLDFGLAKGGPSNVSLPGFTPRYAPLEQILGTGTSPSSDIYSLAATLHHLLVGSPAPDAQTRAGAVLEKQPDPYCPPHQIDGLAVDSASHPGLLNGLGKFIASMIALTPRDRRADCRALLTELQALSVQPTIPEAISARALGEPERPLGAVFKARMDRPNPPRSSPLRSVKPIRLSGESAPAGIRPSSALRRAQLVAPILHGARLLWVDDNPDSLRPLLGIVSALGMHVDLVRTTADFLTHAASQAYDCLVSDIRRGRVPDEGLRCLQTLKSRGPYPGLIFFIGDLDQSRGVPAGAFGVTNSGEEWLHLVLDVLERRRT
jgi:serine/threonine protein kinase